MGRRVYAPHEWTQEELEFLRENYGKMPNSDMMKHFGVSIWQLENKIRQLGLKKYNPNLVTTLTKKLICWYTADGDSVEEIAATLGRPVPVIEATLRECREDGKYEHYQELRQQMTGEFRL